MSRSKHSLDDAYEIWEKFTLLWRRHCKGTEQGLSPRREGFQGIWIDDDGIMLKIIMIIVMQQGSPSMFLCCTDKWLWPIEIIGSYLHARWHLGVLWDQIPSLVENVIKRWKFKEQFLTILTNRVNISRTQIDRIQKLSLVPKNTNKSPMIITGVQNTKIITCVHLITGSPSKTKPGSQDPRTTDPT